MGRIIGISFRVKETAARKPRPTLVAFRKGKKVIECELNTEDDEVDFSRKQFPVGYRKVNEGEDISVFKPHHCRWRRVGDDEDVLLLNEAHLRRISTDEDNYVETCTDVPIEFDGLSEGDQVAMVLGAGNMLAGLLFIQGKKVGAKVYRTPPMHLSQNRDNPDKDRDHVNLLSLFEQKPNLFYEVRQADKELINVGVKLELRMRAMKARITCGVQLVQSTIGQVFLEEETEMEGLVKDMCKALMVSDVVYNALLTEEAKREKELEEVVKATSIWPLFEGVCGVGHRTAAGLMASIGDIRRFKAKNTKRGVAKLMKYCGVHTTPEGGFPRHRRGEVGSWSPEARQALWLIADQFNRQTKKFTKAKDSGDEAGMEKYKWAGKLLQYKLALRQKHPVPVEVESSANSNGKPKKKVKRYTNGHILKMAKWRVMTRFVRWLYKAWARIES